MSRPTGLKPVLLQGNWIRQLVTQEVAQDDWATCIRILPARLDVRCPIFTMSTTALHKVHRRAQEHHCILTRHLPPWKIGGTEHTAGKLSEGGRKPSLQGGICMRILAMGPESHLVLSGCPEL